MAAGAGTGFFTRTREFLEELTQDLNSWAGEQFAQLVKVADGASKAQHMEAANRMLAGMGKALPANAFSAEPSSPPIGAEHIWVWFWEVALTRGSNGFAPNPLSPIDIWAWSQLNGLTLRPWEVRALHMLDQAFLKEQSKSGRKREDDKSGNRAKPRNG